MLDAFEQPLTCVCVWTLVIYYCSTHDKASLFVWGDDDGSMFPGILEDLVYAPSASAVTVVSTGPFNFFFFFLLRKHFVT